MKAYAQLSYLQRAYTQGSYTWWAGAYTQGACILGTYPEGLVHGGLYTRSFIQRASPWGWVEGFFLFITTCFFWQIGAHGKPVVFLHPKDCGGVLVELEEE